MFSCRPARGFCHGQRGNTIIVCDRAVARVILAYFQGTQPDKLPYLDVFPGVIELRRNHSGFVATHLEVSDGNATTAAGPGTTGTAQHHNLTEVSPPVDTTLMP